MKRPVCADLDCGLGMVRTCIGAYVLEHDHRGRPYLLWACDLFTCPGCGHVVAAHFAQVATARRGDDDFERLIALAEKANSLVRQDAPERKEEPPADEPERMPVVIIHTHGNPTDIYAFFNERAAEDFYWGWWHDQHGIERDDEVAVQEVQDLGDTYVELTEGEVKRDGGVPC